MAKNLDDSLIFLFEILLRSSQTVATHFSQEKVVSLGKNSESLQEPYCILE